jgi:hypothetical protein
MLLGERVELLLMLRTGSKLGEQARIREREMLESAECFYGD